MQNAPVVTDKKEVMSVGTLLNRVDIKKKFDEMLGKKAAGFMSSIITAVNNNSSLMKCEPMSIITSAAMAASLDLPINPNLSFAYLIPYKKDGKPVCQFQIGWKGFIQLAIRTGLYKTIHASIVYKDELQSWNPLTSEIKLTPQDEWKMRNTARPIDVAGYMAYFKLTNGFEKYHYMTREQCEAHGKKYSKSYTKGPWTNDPESMSLKTVMKQLLTKYGILSIEMQTAIESDQAAIREDGSLDYVDRQDKPHTVDTTASPVLDIPEEMIAELISLYDILGVNQANGYMEIGGCRSIADLQSLKVTLETRVTGAKTANPEKKPEEKEDPDAAKKREVYEIFATSGMDKKSTIAYIQRALQNKDVQSISKLTLEQVTALLVAINRRQVKCIRCAKDVDCMMTPDQAKDCEEVK